MEKLKPLECPKCESKHIGKIKKTLVCDNCSTVFEGDKQTPKDAERYPRGHDPKYDLGDYIEGTEGVHEY